MKTEIESVLPSGYGHWVVKCFKFNWSRKKPISITSTTTWKATTNNSTLIDDYKMGIKRAEIALIRYCKEYGSKKIEKK
jgi:hypothetical protein